MKKNKSFLNRVFFVLGILLLLGLLAFLIYFQVKEYYNQNDPVLKDIKEMLKSVHPRADEISFHKSDGGSYTINKERIYLCLTDKNGQYYNKNLLVYVSLHELAHVLCNEIGHTQKFHEIFEELLNRAENHGFYNPSLPIDQNYCKHKA